MSEVKKMKYFAGGEWLDTRTGNYSPVFNSSTGEVMAEIPNCSADEVAHAIECAKRLSRCGATRRS